MSIYNSILTPIDVAWSVKYSNGVTILNSCIDFAFAIDILIAFRTTYSNKLTGDEIVDSKEIATNYVKGRFWLDILATIPFDQFVSAENKSGGEAVL